MKTQANRIKPHFFYKLLLSLIAVVIIILIIVFIATDYYISILEHNIITSYRNTLKLITETMVDSSIWVSLDKKINSILNSKNLKVLAESQNPEKDFAHGYPLLGLQDYNYLYKNILHSIYFFNIKKNVVITKTGVVKVNTFFNIYFRDFPQDERFNMDITGYPKPVTYYQKYRSLYLEYVYPFYYEFPGNSGNLIMVNYTEDYFHNFLNRNKTSPQSELFIIKHNGDILAHSNRSKLGASIRNKSILKKIKIGEPFYTDYFGENTLIISCPISGEQDYFENENLSEMATGFNSQDFFVAAIPYEDIYDQPVAVRNTLLLIGGIVIMLAVLISFFISKILYKPIYKLYSLFGSLRSLSVRSVSDINFLEQKIETMLTDRKRLESAVPNMNDQYLFKFLTTDHQPDGGNIHKLLEQEGIRFNHDNFIVSVIEFFYTNEFIKNRHLEEQVSLIDRIYGHIIKRFSLFYEMQVVKIRKNTICIILNVPDNITVQNIVGIIRDLLAAKELNQISIDIFYSISGLHKHINELTQAYREATVALLTLSLYEPRRIAVYKPQQKDEKTYHYSEDEENKLMNYILSGHRNSALRLLNDIIAKNQNKKISIGAMQELYLKLYLSGKYILDKKMVTLAKHHSSEFLNIPEVYKYANVIDLSQNVENFLIKLINVSYVCTEGKLNVQAVVDYINNNFQNDFSLEMIADNFKVSVRHLSLLLKRHLGISYQGYINHLRIRKAKKLLTETNQTLDGISAACGFNSRHTLIRMFKKLEGITPTQYRII